MQLNFHFCFSLLCSHIAEVKALISQGQVTKFQGGISMRNMLMKKVSSVSVIQVLAFQIIPPVVVAMYIIFFFLPVNYFIITRWKRTRKDDILCKQPCYRFLFCRNV